MQSLSFIDEKDIENITKELTTEGYYIVVLDGNQLKTESDFYEKVWAEFKMPRYALNYNAFLDWMRDLDWIPQQKYALIIRHFKDLLSLDLELRMYLFCDFTDIILSWWHKDVLTGMVGGEVRSFRIFLCA